jgi:regulator of protease activity HflC (stomatin/prohibitin superfamily)
LFFIAVIILSAILSAVPYVAFGKWWSLLAGPVFMIIITINTIRRAWAQVPKMWEYIMEVLGEYVGEPLKSGLHLIFPYFGLVEIKSKVYMGDQVMNLYMDENVKEGFGGGAVDFEDGSAPVSAKVFFRIFDSAKATYEIADVLRGIEERMDAALRAYLGKYTIDEATKLRVYFALKIVLNGVKLSSEDGEVEKMREIEERYRDKKTPVELDLEQWGVEIKSLVVTDIILTEAIKELRRLVLEASKKAEAAVFKKKEEITIASARVRVAEYKKREKITLAEGERVALVKGGEGLGEKIKKAAQIAGVKPVQLLNLIKSLTLYENIGDNALIIEGGTSNSAASFGAKFGGGFGKGNYASTKRGPQDRGPDRESGKKDNREGEVKK